VQQAERGAGAARRPGRCAVHPAAPAVGACEVCGRELCLTCAVPVRGTLVGPECLSSVVEEARAEEPVPVPAIRAGDRLALAGFVVVVVVSAFPWYRFGEGPRLFGAWGLHWSLVAAVAGVGGVVIAVAARRRPFDPRLEAALYALLGLVVAGASVLQHQRPPVLSEATSWPWVAAAGGGAAVVGAGRKAAALSRARRSLLR
jgi:hypothetical protein